MTLNKSLRIKKCILRIVTFCIVIALLICIVPVKTHASGTPAITGDVVAAKPDDTVEVNIVLSDNPGIVSATIKVSFDSSVLSLTKVTDNALLGVQSHKPELTSPYTLAWVNDTATKNYESNGAIATLGFKVSKSALYGKTYPIKISYDYDNYDIFDKDLNIIKFQTISGAVKITKDQSFVLGDANHDSNVTIADAVCILELNAQKRSTDSINMVATDVDEDGFSSIMDVTFIQRFLLSKSVPYPIGTKIE